MTLGQRDRRALVLLAASTGVWLVLRLALSGPGEAKLVAAASSIPVAEKRLARLRQLAASVPGKEQVLKNTLAEVAKREKGILQAGTGPQAQAQLMELVRKIGRAQTPPLDIRPGELGQVSALSDDYGEVQVSSTFECHIEDLVNLLADLTRQPEILATKDLRVTTGKDKTIAVRLTVSGVVPRRLVPEKKGLPSF